MFKKILSILMVVVLVFSLSSPAYAVTPGDDMIGQIDLTPEEIAKANAEAKTLFEKLTPSQQAVFLASIEALAYNGDTRLLSLIEPQMERLRHAIELEDAGDHLKILHTPGFINLDCGCGYDMPIKALACLRLDDFREFYC